MHIIKRKTIVQMKSGLFGNLVHPKSPYPSPPFCFLAFVRVFGFCGEIYLCCKLSFFILLACISL